LPLESSSKSTPPPSFEPPAVFDGVAGGAAGVLDVLHALGPRRKPAVHLQKTEGTQLTLPPPPMPPATAAATVAAATTATTSTATTSTATAASRRATVRCGREFHAGCLRDLEAKFGLRYICPDP